MGRALLVILLFLCLAGAAYLICLGAMELMERKAGDNFYARLAEAVEEAPDLSGQPVPADAGMGAEAPARRTTAPAPAGQPVPADAGMASEAPARRTTAPALSGQPVPADAGMASEAPARRTEAPAAACAATATFKPAAERTMPVPTACVNPSKIDFPTLWQTCPNVVGWISLDDSAIDYPVVWGEDNDFYLHHLPDGTPNKAGSIMLDQANSGDFRDAVNILHGHHMRNGSMFGRLADYKRKEYYKEHPVMRLYTPSGDYDVAVFAACTVNGYTFGYPTSFKSEAAFAQFVRDAVSETPYETGVEVQYGDRILLLSTCAYSYTGARFVVMGKLVEPPEAAR